ncbi:E3 ubiquitin/ISG15 ligase TRIM25 isoform X2 [Petaurus breviceps papuanus]|uniref:E3 ubiquitin/ISG15 ligase TRIM25 isoform X2 n=1 Tax=Petaurus breviceps papuanus TaxID=3040969 RepID=UPI0036D9818B
MAELQPLADELTCSICLEIFRQPITTPCGHNFCQSCLAETWTVESPGFYCPQCRACFPERPQLKKNTVLCAVVEQLQQAQSLWDLGQSLCESQDGEPSREGGQRKDEAAGSVACDYCLQAPAAKTCFTCMASYCQEHLRPHLDVARTQLKSKMKQKLTTVCDHISRASSALKEVKLKQHAIQETAARKMDLLKHEYEDMKALIESEERNSLRKLKEEEKRVLDKYDHVHQVLLKKKREIEAMKEEIEHLLNKNDEIAFLEKASKMQELVIKAVYVPKNELDQEMIHNVYQNAYSLKEVLKHKMNNLQEKKTEEAPTPDDSEKPSPLFGPTYPNRDYRQARRVPKVDRPQQKPLRHQQEKSGVTEEKEEKKPKKPAPAPAATWNLNPSVGSVINLTKLKPSLPDTTEKASASPKNSPNQKTKVLEAFLAKSRPELLQYATRVVLDYNTANCKVALSENNTVASVGSAPQLYLPNPKRFTDCSQVLGLQGYKSGVHYWEIELQKNAFCAIGICYGSIDRQGSDSRLGRNCSSWCVEWFNAKISTWHNDVEKNLPLTKATRIGVLLNYDDGFVIFFGITDKVNLIYKYRVEFSEAVYPAFWIFSSGTTLSICPLK